MAEEFLNLQYIISYPGILVVVWLMTQMTKQLFDKKFPTNKTKFVVLGYTFIFVTIWKVVTTLEITDPLTSSQWIGLLVEWLVNIAIVWTSVMKTHELLPSPKKK